MQPTANYSQTNNGLLEDGHTSQTTKLPPEFSNDNTIPCSSQATKQGLKEMEFYIQQI